MGDHEKAREALRYLTTKEQKVMQKALRNSVRLVGTGFAICDVCGEHYDYAPDSPNHKCQR